MLATRGLTSLKTAESIESPAVAYTVPRPRLFAPHCHLCAMNRLPPIPASPRMVEPLMWNKQSLHRACGCLPMYFEWSISTWLTVPNAMWMLYKQLLWCIREQWQKESLHILDTDAVSNLWLCNWGHRKATIYTSETSHPLIWPQICICWSLILSSIVVTLDDFHLPDPYSEKWRTNPLAQHTGPFSNRASSAMLTPSAAHTHSSFFLFSGSPG